MVQLITLVGKRRDLQTGISKRNQEADPRECVEIGDPKTSGDIGESMAMQQKQTL